MELLIYSDGELAIYSDGYPWRAGVDFPLPIPLRRPAMEAQASKPANSTQTEVCNFGRNDMMTLIED